MSISVEQLESGYLYYRLIGSITEDDFQALRSREEMIFGAASSGWCVGVVADFTGLHTIAPQLWTDLRQMRLVQDERICVVVIVGANPYLRALATSLGVTIARHPFVFRDTVDEALNLLGAYSDSSYV